MILETFRRIGGRPDPRERRSERPLVERRELRAFLAEQAELSEGVDRQVGVLCLLLSLGGASEAEFDPGREDRMLDAALERMHGALRQSDAIAILSRNEVLIVLPKVTGVEQAELAAAKLLREMDGPLGGGGCRWLRRCRTKGRDRHQLLVVASEESRLAHSKC